MGKVVFSDESQYTIKPFVHLKGTWRKQGERNRNYKI